MSQGSPLSRFLTDFRTELAQAVQELTSDGRPAAVGRPPAPSPQASPPPPSGPARRPAPVREPRVATPRSDAQDLRFGTGTRGVPDVAPDVLRTLRTPSSLRAAIVVAELLGPPLALRPHPGGHAG